MEKESLKEINENILSLWRELERIRSIVEEPYLDLDESVLREIEESRNSSDENFISDEEMAKEFG